MLTVRYTRLIALANTSCVDDVGYGCMTTTARMYLPELLNKITIHQHHV